jgi:N utilization substance protein B
VSEEGQAVDTESQPLRSRHAAREAALQALYAATVGGLSLQEALTAALEDWNLHPVSQEFTERLANAALRRSSEWDALIEPKLSRNWGLDRLAILDHACLWAGLAELYTEPGIPPKVTITEWVRLSRKYGGKDSNSFVHGVLGALLPQTPKAAWTQDMEEDADPDEEFITALEPEVEELTLEGDDPELEKAKKLGAWLVKIEEQPS